MTNSADPDQLASSEANISGSTLFAKTGHVVFRKRRVKKTSFQMMSKRLLVKLIPLFLSNCVSSVMIFLSVSTDVPMVTVGHISLYLSKTKNET